MNNTVAHAYKNHFRRHDNNFDLLRVVAASLVFFSHAFAIYGLHEPELFSSDGMLYQITFGTFAVNIFFVISGFLVTASWMYDQNPSNFIKKRILRIYPGLIVNVLVVTLVIAPFATSLDISQYFSELSDIVFDIVIGAFLFVIPGLPGLFLDNLSTSVNGVLWTLSLEVFCYLFFVLAIGVSAFNKWWYIILAIPFFAFFYVDIFYPLKFSSDFYFMNSGAFILGGLIFVYKEYIVLSRFWFWSAIASIIILAVFDMYFLPLYLFALAYSVIYIAFAKPRIAIFSKYGDYSYGIYIYAWPVQQTVVQLYGFEANSFLAYMATSFTVIVFFAILSWHFVENPALKLKYSRGYSMKHTLKRES